MGTIYKAILAIGIFAFCMTVDASALRSISFYYNEVDSIRELINYQRVVLEPENVTDCQIRQLKNSGVRVYAYLSVGELDTEPGDDLKDSVKVKNENWDSTVMDVSSENWRSYLLKQASSLKKRGFDGLFLDTLDSFNLYTDRSKDPEYYNEQVSSLKNLVNSIHKILPSVILNRGFEIVLDLDFRPDAVAFESLFSGFDNKNSVYTTVSENDREWLESKLSDIRKKGIEVIAIDYLDDQDQKKRTELAKKILSKGYTPYVTDGLLNGFGTSTVYPVPKRVLALYDARFSSLILSSVHSRLTTPLEYLGYAVDAVDVNSMNYSLIDKTRYAAVVFYLENGASYIDNPELEEFIQKNLYNYPFLFLGAMPQKDETLKLLGIDNKNLLEPPYKIIRNEELSKGIINPKLSSLDGYSQLRLKEGNGYEKLILVEGKAGKQSVVAFKTPWGGGAISPYPADSLSNNQDIWLVDPFKFLKITLNLPEIPAADVTTESGLRILTSHVDGDGFPSKSWFKGSPLVSEVLYEHVFKAIDVPHTVSVIQGEVAKDGMYPNDSEKLEAVARKIFELPNVEIASHTFSHPFNWDPALRHANKVYGEHLPIPGYELDYKKELEGSVEYINKNLAPLGKKVKVFLWSGAANPSGDIVERSDRLGILNLNGANTTIKKGEESLTNVFPTVCWHKDAVQVYAPEMNENVYTNEWTEHFDGFARAKETYALTGSPRRLKTISIYYHMYSGTYESSLRALKSLYTWALSQKVTPLYISDYATRARTLYETGLSRDLSGRLHINSSGVRSVRVPKSFGYPAGDIAGFNPGEDGNYLILKQKRNQVFFKSKPESNGMLKSANGILEKWNVSGKKIDFSFRSYVPLNLEVWSDNRCQMVSNIGFDHERESSYDRFMTEEKGLISGTLICK